MQRPTLINQGASKIDREAPRLDLLGMNAVAKFVKPKLPIIGGLFPLALGGDLISNTLYYSMAEENTKGSTLLRGALLGSTRGHWRDNHSPADYILITHL